MTDIHDRNPSKCRSSRAQDRSGRAWLIAVPPKRKCKACPTLLRSGNTGDYCSLHAHFSVVEKDQKIESNRKGNG